MNKLEKQIVDITIKYFHYIMLAGVFVLSVLVRRRGMYLISGDFNVYLQPWFDTLKENGGLQGLRLGFSNYYIPYLCILAIGTYFDGINSLNYIKIVSIVSEYVCAVLSGAILLQLSPSQKKRDAAIIVSVLLLSPMIFLNGAYWAQCDYIYIAFILGSILLLLKDRFSLSFLLLGIAFCFKQQTVFVLPAYILYYICSRKFSVLHFLWIPITYIIGGLPAIIAGRPALEVYLIYLNQAADSTLLSVNTPNFWTFFPREWHDFSFWGIVLTITLFLILAFIMFNNNYALTNQTFLLICLCSSGICVMLLPAMHERYTSLYVLLAYLYFIIYDRKKILIPILLDLITCITYFRFLYSFEIIQYSLLAIVNLGILYFLIMYTMQKLKQD